MLLSEKERANIRHRLRIGNSVKVIALNYTGLKGIREEIEDIQAEMQREKLQAGRCVMRVPSFIEMERRQSREKPTDECEIWFRRLDLSLQRLVREACDYHDIALSQFMRAKNGRQARKMVAHAMRFRWAMTYEQIAEQLCCSYFTAQSLCREWKGKSAVSTPDMPEMPRQIAAMVRAAAGEYGTTEWAIMKGIGLHNVGDQARKSIAFKLYCSKGCLKAQIKGWIACDKATVTSMIKAHAKAKGVSLTEVENMHAEALEQRRPTRRLIEAE
ncbi:hypothetical protein [uncultured Cohaesibacter sp.]|uniref:hypothetical protein n=1 Tax=uncultured Cohaesibacter sp. TaxID=1002546 RepID=UPI002AAC2424|nr:hypothetical protein [uncultured Cohaesibacter sp.]